jgi:hypothetical protein
MKKIYLIAGLVTSSLFFSCEEEEQNTPAPSPSANQVVSTTDVWKLNLKIEENEDITNEFSQFEFKFLSQGVLQVTDTQSNTTTTGSWLIFEDDGVQELRISNLQNQALDELNDDWYRVELNDSTMWFRDNLDGIMNEVKFIKQ